MEVNIVWAKHESYQSVGQDVRETTGGRKYKMLFKISSCSGFVKELKDKRNKEDICDAGKVFVLF